MTSKLRDAIAAALYNLAITSDRASTWEQDADAILSDPAFREALVEAVGDALYADGLQVRRQNEVPGWMVADEVARAIVDRMLP